ATLEPQEPPPAIPLDALLNQLSVPNRHGSPPRRSARLAAGLAALAAALAIAVGVTRSDSVPSDARPSVFPTASALSAPTKGRPTGTVRRVGAGQDDPAAESPAPPPRPPVRLHVADIAGTAEALARIGIDVEAGLQTIRADAVRDLEEPRRGSDDAA